MGKVAKFVGAVVAYAVAATAAAFIGPAAAGLIGFTTSLGNYSLRVRDSDGEEWVAVGADD